jgi:hypothetical protein
VTSHLTDQQIASWRLLKQQYQEQPEVLAYYQTLDAQRLIVRQQMVTHLNDYIAGRISTEQFRETFDHKTREGNEWGLFGLGSFSGGMYTNMLVKYAPDESRLALHLKMVLRVPQDVERARSLMNSFRIFLEGIIRDSHNNATTDDLQPGRIPFLISMWWHMQNMEQWPIYYERTRTAFEREKLYKNALQPIDTYFLFRETFLELVQALRSTSWELEHMCDWMIQGKPSHMVQRH